MAQPPEPSIPSSSTSNWDDQDNSSKGLKSECKGVFNVNEAVMMYEIFSGKDKDYYLTTSTKALHQNFNLYKKVLIGDAYEEQARVNLRQQGISNPTRHKVACAINDMLRPEYEELSRRIVDAKKQPEEWIDILKAAIREAFGK